MYDAAVMVSGTEKESALGLTSLTSVRVQIDHSAVDVKMWERIERKHNRTVTAKTEKKPNHTFQISAMVYLTIHHRAHPPFHKTKQK